MSEELYELKLEETMENPQEAVLQQSPLTKAVLIEEYGFPLSVRLLAEDERLQPGDYLIDSEKKQILLVADGCTYQVFKKNRLALKLRQRSTKRPDLGRFSQAVRIDASEAPVAHQLALLPVGSYVEVPRGKFGITTASGVKRGSQETAFTDIMPETITNLHPPKKAREQKDVRQTGDKQSQRRQSVRKPAGRGKE